MDGNLSSPGAVGMGHTYMCTEAALLAAAGMTCCGAEACMHAHAASAVHVDGRCSSAVRTIASAARWSGRAPARSPACRRAARQYARRRCALGEVACEPIGRCGLRGAGAGTSSAPMRSAPARAGSQREGAARGIVKPPGRDETSAAASTATAERPARKLAEGAAMCPSAGAACSCSCWPPAPTRSGR